jgi:hypothetical protein
MGRASTKKGSCWHFAFCLAGVTNNAKCKTENAKRKIYLAALSASVSIRTRMARTAPARWGERQRRKEVVGILRFAFSVLHFALLE